MTSNVEKVEDKCLRYILVGRFPLSHMSFWRCHFFINTGLNVKYKEKCIWIYRSSSICGVLLSQIILWNVFPLLPPWCEVSLIICSIVSLILRGRSFQKFLSAVSNNLFQKNYNKPRALETSLTTLMVIEIGTKKSRSHWGTSDHLRTLRITAKFSLRFTGVRGKTLQKLSTLSPITVCN